MECIYKVGVMVSLVEPRHRYRTGYKYTSVPKLNTQQHSTVPWFDEAHHDTYHYTISRHHPLLISL